jgi:hypothetical protein
VVDLTLEGKKVTLPSPGKPVYYFPVVSGYHEVGAITAGEKPPPKTEVIHLLAEALAKQGYFVVSKASGAPSLLLVFHWGYMNPQIEDFGTGDPAQKVFFNQREMLGLVAGHTLGNLDLSFEREDVMQAAEDDRYFVVVAAYDYEAALKHQKKMLWSAKMSTPSNGVSIGEVIPALIASGAPQFGRETNRPKWITAPVNSTPKVELGTPEVKEYLPATTGSGSDSHPTETETGKASKSRSPDKP